MRYSINALFLVGSLLGADRISKPGEYAGFSPQLFSEHITTSQYVAVRDGTRLAIDIYRPAANGQAAPGKFPVVWMFTPYQRAVRGADGKLTGRNVEPELGLIRYGYIVAIADVRGRGASFGWRRGFQDQTEALDGYDLNEWLAKQPWSTGKIGMAGCSYLGGSQMEILTTVPPHLKAIFPGCTDFDKYDMDVRGGLTAQFGTNPKGTVSDPFPETELTTAPVDEDRDGSLLRQAVAEHARGTSPSDLWKEIPYRDDWSPLTHSRYYAETSLATYLDKINRSGIATYHWGNWQDEESESVILSYANLKTPHKLWMGAWGHCQVKEFDMIAEQLRYFDYWLKGIDNGVMKDPPILYYTMNAPHGTEWRSTKQWPLPEQQQTKFYLHSASALNTTAPSNESADSYTVDYNVSCKTPVGLWPCSLDDKARVYTTDPLPSDMQITGHPVVHFWVASSTIDGHFFAALEDVDPNGAVTVIAPGRLRGLIREVNPPAFNFLGLPWHRANRADAKPMDPGVPTELAFALLPTSNVFKAGHRIRLTLTGADPRERSIVPLKPAPIISIYHDTAHASYVTLPVIPMKSR